MKKQTKETLEAIEQLEAHFERLWLRKLEGETRFGEARPVVVVESGDEPPF